MPSEDDLPAATVAPEAWIETFAATLVRLYPNTPKKIALEAARRRCPVECTFDPVSAAEAFALNWGAPVRAENAIPNVDAKGA